MIGKFILFWVFFFFLFGSMGTEVCFPTVIFEKEKKKKLKSVRIQICVARMIPLLERKTLKSMFIFI